MDTIDQNDCVLSNINNLTGAVIGAAMEVHKCIGPGLLETVCEACLCREFEERIISFGRQKNIPIRYKNMQLECAYHLDLVVENKLIVEVNNRTHSVRLEKALKGHFLSGTPVPLW